MSEYAIEKGIKMPRKVRVSKRSKYPFKEMEVGDSTFIEGKRASDLGSSISYIRKIFPGRAYATRRVEGGVRVWRVA